MFKKVYVEITNICNLNCPFCLTNNRSKRIMSKDEFNIVLEKLEGYTKYLYFHVLGEPLMHPNILEFIDLASKKYQINITTNGYLIDKIKCNKNIRQINVSLHSFNENEFLSLNDYLNNIMKSINELKKYSYISLRLWQHTKYYQEIISYLNNYYDTNIVGHQKLEENVFIDLENTFFWPTLDRKETFLKGKCYALKDHIAILCDGTIVPCCLDGKGVIKLGNIFTDNLSDVIKSEKYQNMLNGFKKEIKVEKLCQKCNFL